MTKKLTEDEKFMMFENYCRVREGDEDYVEIQNWLKENDERHKKLIEDNKFEQFLDEAIEYFGIGREYITLTMEQKMLMMLKNNKSGIHDYELYKNKNYKWSEKFIRENKDLIDFEKLGHGMRKRSVHYSMNLYREIKDCENVGEFIATQARVYDCFGKYEIKEITPEFKAKVAKKVNMSLIKEFRNQIYEYFTENFDDGFKDIRKELVYIFKCGGVI